jgi:hypothetical protein
MFFGEVPDFDGMIEAAGAFAERFNALSPTSS